MPKIQTSPKGSKWVEVEDDPALSSAAKLAIATLQAAGKLPVGTNRIIDSGALQDPAAKVIASGVGRFIKIEANQIVASNADFEEAVVKKIWAKIVTAKEGAFDKITSNMISAGALDGQIITGATVRTAGDGRGRMVLDANGLRLVAADGKSDKFRVDSATGNIQITGSLSSNDDWSYAKLDDIGATHGDGNRYGMGLIFNRLVGSVRYSGGIFLRQSEKGALQTVIAPPTGILGSAGHFIVGQRELGWGGDYASFDLNGGLIDLQVNRRTLEFSNGQRGIILANGLNETRIVATGQRREALFHAGSLHTTDNGVLASWDKWRISSIGGGRDLGFAYGDNTGAYLWSGAGANYAKIGEAGFTSTGRTKKFSMHVPHMSEARGGEMLQHKTTESPFDGIEYWNVVTLDAEGKATWELPDYVPAIASRKAPWATFSSADRGQSSAKLEKGDDRFRVHVTGEPGAEVSLLVKGARIVEIEGAAGGVSKWQDFGDGEDVWASDMVPDLIGDGPHEPHRTGEIIW